MSRSQNMDLAFETLRQLKEVPANGLFHTDQAFMYTNQAFAVELEKMGLQQGLSHRANCWNNAVIKSFNGSMKCGGSTHTITRTDGIYLLRNFATR